MCNLDNLKVGRRAYLDALTAGDDPANELEMTKNYVAPGKPGYVVRINDGRRVLSTMKRGPDEEAPQTSRARGRDAVPRLVDQLPQPDQQHVAAWLL